MLKTILINGLKTGFVLAATTTATIMLVSDRETGSPWAAINDIAHVVDGDDKIQPVEFAPRESRLGIFVNGTAMALWGILYEGALAVSGFQSNPMTAALATTTAYVTDYHIVPKRFTPGIEKRLSGKALLVTYAALGATFALSSLWNKSEPSA